MNRSFRVLIVEDSEDDVLLAVREFRRAGYDVIFERVDTADAVATALAKQTWDLVIADYSMPHFSGTAALELLKQTGLDIPFIFVSGTIGEDTAVAAMKAGAHDYVMKGNLKRLVPAVERELREAEVRRERKRAEEAQRRTERRFRELVESAPDAIVGVNREGRITLVNAQTERLFSYTREQLLGQPVETLVPERFRGAHVGYRAGYVSTPQMRPMGASHHLYGRRKDGSEFPVEISLSPLETEEGLLVTAIIRDITERKRLEEKARHKDRLEDILHFKSEFIANMSHELRTPLNSIIGFSELLEDQLAGPLTDKQRGYIHNVWTSGKHLLDLINDILDLSKVEAGKIELHVETFPLREALVAALTMVRPQTAKKRISLRSEIVAETRVTADPLRFKQIMYNLLSNAIKFTPEGGQVTVAARTAQEAFVEIAVTDTGIGIRTEDLPKLFREFSQVGGEHTREQQGTGLGLALSKRLVELHGGQIWVESEGENKGSTFIFTLPISGPTSSGKS